MTTLKTPAVAFMALMILLQVNLDCSGMTNRDGTPSPRTGLINNRPDARCITAATQENATEDIIRMLSSSQLTQGEYATLREELEGMGIESNCPAYFNAGGVTNPNVPTARCQRAAISAGLDADTKNLLNMDAEDLSDADITTIRTNVEGAGIKASCLQYFE